MSLDNYESFLYSIIFLVPGYIMNSAYEKLVNIQKKTISENLLRFLVFSLLNYALWGGVIFSAIRKRMWIDDFLLWVLLIISVLVISPYIFGFIFGLVTEREWGRNLLRKVGINTLHPNPTAWDYVVKKGAWLSVTLKDGTIIKGNYGGESFAASSSEAPQDLFMQARYKVGEVTRKWERIEPPRGVWIPYNEIKYMEVRLKDTGKTIKKNNKKDSGQQVNKKDEKRKEGEEDG
ncbi:MAG: DUF6338 family protein [Bacillota bacterium]